MKREIIKLYHHTTSISPNWLVDEEISVPCFEEDDETAHKCMEFLEKVLGAKHYETATAHIYEIRHNYSEMTKYVFYK